MYNNRTFLKIPTFILTNNIEEGLACCCEGKRKEKNWSHVLFAGPSWADIFFLQGEKPTRAERQRKWNVQSRGDARSRIRKKNRGEGEFLPMLILLIGNSGRGRGREWGVPRCSS